MATIDVFVDTAGFLALWDASDSHHAEALLIQAALTKSKRRFITTDYVIDETATLLLLRHSHYAATDFLSSIQHSESITLEWIGPETFHGVVSFFQKHSDKEWSFTDCASFLIMRKLRIKDAFTTDHHFKQAGFTPLLNP